MMVSAKKKKMSLVGFQGATWTEYTNAKGKYFSFQHADDFIIPIFKSYLDKAEEEAKKPNIKPGKYFERTEDLMKRSLLEKFPNADDFTIELALYTKEFDLEESLIFLQKLLSC